MRLPDWLRVVRTWRTENTIEAELEVDYDELRQQIEGLEALLEEYGAFATCGDEPEPVRRRHAPPPAFDINAGQIGRLEAVPLPFSERTRPIPAGGDDYHQAVIAYLAGFTTRRPPVSPGGRPRPDEAPGVLLEDLLNDIDKELGQ